MISVSSAEELEPFIGEPLRTAPLIIDAEMVDAFCRLSGDRQWIHQADAAERIVPGNLLIAQLPRFLQSAVHVEGMQRALTVKYESVRFIAPLITGAAVAATLTISSVRRRAGGTFVAVDAVLSDADSHQEVMRASLTDRYE